MIKKVYIAITVILLVLMYACSVDEQLSSMDDIAETDSNYQNGYDAGYEKGYEDGINQMNDSEYDSGYQDGYSAGVEESLKENENTEKDKEASSEEYIEDILGTRKKPAGISDVITVEIDNSFSKGIFTITLKEIMSGEEAWNFVYSCNKFNDEPDGWYYLLANFEVVFTQDLSNDDSPLELDDFDFDLSTSDFSVSSSKGATIGDYELDLTLYEGASGSGWVVFRVPEDELYPYAVFRDNIWFRLNEDE